MINSRHRQTDKVRLDQKGKTLLIRKWLEEVISDGSYQRIALKDLPREVILMFQWFDVMYNGFYPLYHYIKKGSLPTPDWDPRVDDRCAEWVATLSHRFFCEYLKRRGDIDMYESDGLFIANDQKIRMPERAWKSLDNIRQDNNLPSSGSSCKIGEHYELQFGDSAVRVRYI